jgi:Na+/H+ antiporter NhaC
VTDAPWYSIVPPLLAVTAALMTNRMLTSLFAAVVVGGWLAAWHVSTDFSTTAGGGFVKAGNFFVRAVASLDNQLILLYVVLIMMAIAVVLVSGGLQGVANWLMRFARGRRSAQFVTFLAGLLIFIDDYANTMIVGSTMRPVTDGQRISREKLAFLVDATAAPIAGIALISTWIGYEVGLLGEIAKTLSIDKAGYAMLIDALGFRFYCLMMIIFVAVNTLSGADFGSMAVAERRARRQGKLLADGGELAVALEMGRAQPHRDAKIHAATAVIPMAVMLGVFLVSLWYSGGGPELLANDRGALLRVAVWREVFGSANSIPLLAWSSGIGLAAAFLCSWLIARTPWSAMGRAVWIGFKASLMPVSVLVLAWSLKGACEDLQTGEFLSAQLKGTIAPTIFPALVFIVAGATAFATGTSYGTMAILIPTAVPVAFSLDGDVYGTVTILSIAAILDGAIFGDHCSPISDTTIMSSAASACHHVDHVRTQMPYSLAVAAMALFLGYLPAGLGLSNWGSLAGCVVICLALFGWLALRTGRSGGEDPTLERNTSPPPLSS